MPFIRTHVPRRTSPATRQSVVEAIHGALVDAIGMPADELFNMMVDYDETHFWCSKTFNGIARSAQVIVIEITLRRGRSDAMKRALYAKIVERLCSTAEVSPNDVFIFCHENDYSDWSVGQGRFAMNLVQQIGVS
jgi:phenylpyruvate tautomerase PptA (4-oxalocrotonate tautomerase family)